ncbi:MAG: DnaA N-terminal domain-containing protein [Deltaproteobacteria bacterium]|nr:DnaA N-terminal domain-containing protein [Deltaproteobacteria bacterium]
MKFTWDTIKQQVSTTMPARGFQLWINPIRFVEQKGKQVVLGCPNRFSKSWVEENYLDLIHEPVQGPGSPGGGFGLQGRAA